MNITVALLIYKSPAYLDFVMKSLLEHPSEEHNVDYLIVCNDATEEVIDRADYWANKVGTSYIVHENINPDDWWIQNVYNAWNRCLKECKTEAICFVNSDMAFSNGWLDALAHFDIDRFIPTSLLVESGRMPSLAGLISKNFGQTLATFDKVEFEKFAEQNKGETLGGFIKNQGAYMPSLFRAETLRRAGGWQKNRGNIPGDKITFALLHRYFGLTHIMVENSIAYHFQRGESIETGDA